MVQIDTLQEPVAFWGGVFAGVLGLNLDEEPLKSWVERTSGKVGRHLLLRVVSSMTLSLVTCMRNTS